MLAQTTETMQRYWRVRVYVHRIRHYVGAYLAALGARDTIVFTAGVGEHDAWTRQQVYAGWEASASRWITERTTPVPEIGSSALGQSHHCPGGGDRREWAIADEAARAVTDRR